MVEPSIGALAGCPAPDAIGLPIKRHYSRRHAVLSLFSGSSWRRFHAAGR
jgi:hypothetical protein